MNDSRVKLWLADALPREVETPLRRLARAAGVVRVAERTYRARSVFSE